VVGLAASATGWLVDVVTDNGTVALEATSVVLATGGYVTPREHRSIDGPRPSGIMTADFVADALDRGWRPGRRVIVAGRGRVARGTAERLVRAGVDVIDPGRTTDPSAGPAEEASVGAVRGERRLEGVLIDGRWMAADALVLADALCPASFLLRGLGIGDERPGVPMPADGSGALPLPNLWAAGTCVDPRVEHDRSLTAGIAVGRAIVTAGLRSRGTTASARR